MGEPIQPVTMPKWGIEMTEGTINQWNIREGEHIEKGAPLLEVETEKIVNTVESPASGTLRRIVAGPGESKAVGSLVAVLADAHVSDAEVSRFIAGFRGASVSFEPESPVEGQSVAEVGAQSPGGEPRIEPASPTDGDAHISPIAKRLAQTLGVDVAEIRGTGRHGRITKEDVEAYAVARSVTSRTPAGQAGEAVSANPPTRTRLSATRATIARRMLQAKQTIPDYRLTMDVEAGELVSRCEELRIQSGVRITLNDLLVKACALALVEHPTLNARLEGEELLQYPHADIAIAVATEGGLITPVVRGADTKSVAEIARSTAELAERARSAGLSSEEVTHATFTISNLGRYGLAHFDAIINPPQVAILAVGSVQERVVMRRGAPTEVRIVSLTLTADHRVVDGAAGAAFLVTLKEFLEAPQRLS